MCNDIRFLYTIIKNCEYINPNYYTALMPYIGIIIDGVEDWINAYINSMKDKLDNFANISVRMPFSLKIWI